MSCSGARHRSKGRLGQSVHSVLAESGGQISAETPFHKALPPRSIISDVI